MAIGDLLHQTLVTTPDPYTGCPVTRLTPPDHTSHHMYFYNRMVTSDSSRLLYCAEINGRRNLYLMELATGDAVQLTEGDALDDYGASGSWTWPLCSAPACMPRRTAGTAATGA